MPHSSHDALTAVLDAVVQLRPNSVLDVGPGYGKWGLLIREALDFMGGRHSSEEFSVRIDAIEAFEGYDSPLYDWVYNQVRRGDIRELATELDGYDLVFFGDVIEHMEKDEGVRVLEAVLAKSRNVIVTTPAIFFQQEALDNAYEQHLSFWERDDFRRWPYDFQRIGITNIAVLGGRGATWPTAADSRINDAVYRVPGFNRGAVRPALAKRVARRLVR